MKVPAVQGIISNRLLRNNELLRLNYDKMSKREKQRMREAICKEILSEKNSMQSLQRHKQKVRK